jgi:hypothetical protein
MKFALAVPALLFAAPAVAQTTDQDVRCVIAGNVFAANDKDPARKQLALATSLFFAGRVDARLSPAQTKAAVATQGKALTAANAPGVMTECARQFQAKERAMQAIGQQVAAAQGGAKPAPIPPATSKR